MIDDADYDSLFVISFVDCNLNYQGTEAFDYEISPVELVQDIGVLILEARLPEFSANGRKEGIHCWPVCPDSRKKCCPQKMADESSMVS